MKIITADIEKFGALKNTHFDFSDGLNSFVEKNGWGKSTLAAFVKAMLYGMEYSRGSEFNDRKHFMTWNENFCGGSLVVEWKENKYKICRSFGEKKSGDRLEVFECKSNLPTDVLGDIPGLTIFGIDGETFERSAFVDLNSSKQPEKTDSINAKLNNLLESDDDTGNFNNANSALEDIINAYSSGRRKEAKIPLLKNKIVECKEKLFELDEIEKEAEVKNENLKSVKMQYTKISAALKLIGEKKILYAQKNLSDDERNDLVKYENLFTEKNINEEKINSYVEKLNAKEILVEEKKCCEQEIEECEKKLRGVKKSRAGKYILGFLFSVLGIAAVLFSAYEFIFVKNIFIAGGTGVFAIVFILLTLIILFTGKCRKDKKLFAMEIIELKKNAKKISEQIEMQEKEISDFIKKVKGEPSDSKYFDCGFELSKLQNDFYSYRKLSEKKKSLEELGKNVNINFDQMHSAENSLNEKKSALEKNIINLERTLETQTELLEERRVYEEKLISYQEELKTAEKKLDNLKKAKYYLELANNNLSLNYSGKMGESFKKYISLLDKDLADSVLLNANFENKIETDSSLMDGKYLSSGTEDLVNFCTRMALVDALFDKEKPVLVLDDPFVNLDDEKLIKVKKLLKKISEEYQVIYFTCSSARA